MFGRSRPSGLLDFRGGLVDWQVDDDESSPFLASGIAVTAAFSVPSPAAPRNLLISSSIRIVRHHLAADLGESAESFQ